MDLINYSAKKHALLSVRGHPYDRNEFFEVFEDHPDIMVTGVEQPATRYVLESPGITDFDALVFYDMPGIDFHHRPPQFVEPPLSLKLRFEELTKTGLGMVFLHHAIAGWPAWPEYGEIIGGRFYYRPTQVGDRRLPSSGYRHAVEYTARVLCDHPVTAGVPASFPITDELYLYQVFDDGMIPLLASDYDFDAANFNSAYAAVSDDSSDDDTSDEEWLSVTGSNLIGWVRRHNNSPIVYLQLGDTPAVYQNPVYRQLIFNAINWVASDEAREWARTTD